MSENLIEYSQYRDLSYLLVGLGTLLIDGDALIDYIQLNSNNVSISEVNSFIRMLQKCGFKRIEILIFSDYFTKPEIYSQDDLKKLYSNQVLLVFKNCETDREWFEYISNESISTILTNINLNCGTTLLQNSYIAKIMTNNEINISLLNELEFSGTTVSTFLLDYRLFLKNDLNKLSPIVSMNSVNTPNSTDYSTIRITNQYVEQILQNRPLRAFNSSSIADSSLFNSMWNTIVKSPREALFQEKSKNELKENQKLSKHLERYSQALDSNKLHHHIVLNRTDKHSNAKISNELLLRDSDENRNEDRKQVENIEKNILKGLELNDQLAKIDSLIEQAPKAIHSKIYVFLLRKLKLRQLSNDKTKQSFLIKEIIENHEDLLEKNEIEAYLKDLEAFGFKETAKFLNKNVPPTREIDEDSFNKEIFLQLKYNGDKLKRSLNSKNDPRVRFQPDDWQVKLLDIVDRNDSALVCCPTSSGKTFICFYAMEKILRSSNHDDMIIFVAPNKTLVNQILVEIYSRFSYLKYPNNVKKFVFAVHMPDYDINDPYNCQILITVPTMLETFLCINTNSNNKIENIKYVIIDEIHTINNESSIETIMHLLDCPLLGLSATITNFDEFFNWFDSIVRLKNKRLLHKISHYERYSDLQRFLFLPNADNLIPISEMFAYTKTYLKKYDYAHDFHLLPTEIATILDSLEIVLDEENEKQVNIIYSCFPDSFFKTTLISKNDVKEYEKFLMKNFKDWIMNDVFNEMQLERLYSLLNGKSEKAFEEIKKKYGALYSTNEWALENIFELVEKLKSNKMLPAIVFTKSMEFADDLTRKLVMTLQDRQSLEERSSGFKETQKLWKNELKGLEKRVKMLEKKREN